MRRNLGLVFAAAILAGVTSTAMPAIGAEKGSYEWYVDGPPFGPNVSEARDGYQIEVEGTGSFFVGKRRTSVVGGGPYRLLDANGDEVGSGIWEAKGSARYDDQGELMPLALIDRYRRGVLVAPVDFGKAGKGTITIYCAAGDEDTEGIRVRLNTRNFNEIVAGNTIFRRSDHSPLPGPR